MVDYQKAEMVDGTLVENPAWYIGDILTRHLAGVGGRREVCAKVLELRRSQFDADPLTGARYDAMRRLELARATPCTCGHE